MDFEEADFLASREDSALTDNFVQATTTNRFGFHLMMVKAIAIITFGSGLLNLFSVAGRHLPQRLITLEKVFPLEFIHLSKFLVMLIGFALVISSLNIFKRKKRAYQSVLALSGASIFFHLTRSLNFEEATISLLLIGLLLYARKSFTVKSSIQTIPLAFLRAILGLFIALLYGAGGFWLIEQRHFGINFHWNDAFAESLRFLTLAGDPSLEPLTRHAHWFINSLYVMSITAIAYAFYSIYRPMIYRYRIHPREQIFAREIIGQNGRSAMDFFKVWPDKSFYF
jgi:phosphatidylglycerol lysyltransferase